MVVSTLQMDSSPIPWSEGVHRAQLGLPIADVFAEIDQTLLAATSVAQAPRDS